MPIVLYHGAAAWPEPRAFDDLLGVPAALRSAVEPYVVRFRYLLHDSRVEQRVAAASFEQIETWSAQVLSAATLADVLAD